MPQFLAHRPRRTVVVPPVGTATPAPVRHEEVSWILRTEVRFINIAIVALWLGLEAGHVWRRLRAWLDWAD